MAYLNIVLIANGTESATLDDAWLNNVATWSHKINRMFIWFNVLCISV